MSDTDLELELDVVPTRRSFLTAVPALLLTPGLVGCATDPSPAPPGTAPSGAASTSPAPPAGPQQSPVALSTADAVPAPELPELVVDYPRSVDLSVRYVSRDPDDPTGCTTRGREETIEAEVPAGAAGISLDGVRYELKQFHFHTASEHTLDGRRYAVEQHFVHAGPNGETLVIGRFLDGGGPGGTTADRVLDDLPEECGDEIAIAGADLAGDLPADLSTLRYPGSLTTKPNTEGVSWLVLRTPGSVADETISEVRELFPDGDARDLQPLNGRVVRLREQ